MYISYLGGEIMSFIIDIIIIAIILLFTFIGYKRGLVKLAFSLCTFFIAIVVAFSLYKPVSNFILDKTSIDESIEKTITNKILPNSTDSAEFSSDSNLPQVIIDKGADTIEDLAHSFSTTIVGICCFVAIYIIAKIALKFVTALANLIAKLPLLKQFNELGGLLYGIVQGTFIVFVGFAIISLASPLIDTVFLTSVNNSLLGGFIYNNNLLLNFIN